MRVLVTGGAGFIGSALVRHLVMDEGLRVLTLDKLTYAGNRASLADLDGRDGHCFAEIDVCDASAVSAAIDGFRPDRIIHLAAESHVDRSIAGAAPFIATNVVGTFVLLEATRSYWEGLKGEAQRRFRLVHVSTDEVYGSIEGEGRFEEGSPFDPSSPYAASKAAADHLVMAWHRTYGLPAIVTHSSNNYGPRQYPEKLIPLMILNAAEGRVLPVYGDGANIRDWLHVEDHVRALHLIASAGRPGERYNIGGDNEQANIALVRRICEIMDGLRPEGAPHDRLIRFVADRPGHDRRYAVDAGKLHSVLGWQPREAFPDALERTVRWYLDNGAWWRPLRNGCRRAAGEVGRNEVQPAA